MFDMGFTEMMLIGIVALIVIGPERLPGVARTAGKYFGRLKRFMTSVKADVEQELRADELREILAEQQKELDKLKNNISDAGREFEKQASDAGRSGPARHRNRRRSRRFTGFRFGQDCARTDGQVGAFRDHGFVTRSGCPVRVGGCRSDR